MADAEVDQSQGPEGEGSAAADAGSEGGTSESSSATASPSAQPKAKGKVDILLKATGDAPIMKKRRWTVEPNKKIGGVVQFMKKYLKYEASESLFLYVNQSFAPAMDIEIGTLFECFGSDGKLVLHYCKTQAWG